MTGTPVAVRRRRAAVALAGVLLLAALVLLVVVRPGGGGERPASAAGTATATAEASEAPARTPSPPPTPTAPAAPVLVVPPTSGSGTLVPTGAASGANATGRTVRYAVEVEADLDGIVVPADFAGEVHAILGDAQGWQPVLGIAFEQVADPAQAEITVSLATPATVDAQCLPLDTGGEVSCWNGQRAMINALRWQTGSPTYGADLPNYRRYLIAHEVGHGLGRHHVGCPSPGAPAPVMVQQTKSLEGCAPNPYPLVTGG